MSGLGIGTIKTRKSTTYLKFVSGLTIQLLLNISGILCRWIFYKIFINYFKLLKFCKLIQSISRLFRPGPDLHDALHAVSGTFTFSKQIAERKNFKNCFVYFRQYPRELLFLLKLSGENEKKKQVAPFMYIKD